MAFNAVSEVLAAFPWLQALGDDIYQVLVNGVTNNDPFDVIIQAVRDTPAYKRRFSGLIKRQSEGFAAITEAEYMVTEQGYRDQLMEFGLLGTLGLTDMEAFREWAGERIGLDVSVAEINRRLDRAAALTRDSGEEANRLFSEWYGAPVTDDALMVWFLDEKQGMDIIEDQIAAVQVGGEAFRFGLNITRTRAEILRKEGVTTADLARQGFSDVARELPILTRLAQIHNTTPLSQMELEEFFFHDDPEVASKRGRTFSQALASFQSPGSLGRTQTGGLAELIDRDRAV